MTIKVIVNEGPEKISIIDTLNLEMWLNDHVANEAYAKFGVGLRFHITADEK